MSAKANQIKIGAFVLGGIALLVVAVAVLGSGRFFRRTYPFVSYFDGSVNGLRPGAAVKFKGVEIGSVDRIRIPFRVDSNDQPIEVFYKLDSEILEAGAQRSSDYGDTLQEAIGNGLRAQLESDSLLTGVLHVSVAFSSDEKPPVFHDPIEGVMEIPTVPPPLQEIGSAIRTIVDKVGQYDLTKLLADLDAALVSVGDLARSPEIRSALVSLDKSLQSVERTFARLETHIDPIAKGVEDATASVVAASKSVGEGVESLKSTMGTIQKVTADTGAAVAPILAGLEQNSKDLQSLAHELEGAIASARVLLDPDAPIVVELQTTLRSLGDAARATRALFELLGHDPAALLRGKSIEEEQSR
jgi:paraquat-inducible protein B